jgi:DNA-directed RNA polymerase subunit M/transcription elongation factor TFIIS
MHFCTQCENMYYVRLSGENKDKLTYYCRKCGHEDDNLLDTEENICISRTDLKQSTSSYDHIINKYTKLDPTLPHIQNIRCPNVNCLSNEGGEQKNAEKVKSDILYLRYDDASMKFVYICTHCDTVWKSSDDK